MRYWSNAKLPAEGVPASTLRDINSLENKMVGSHNGPLVFLFTAPYFVEVETMRRVVIAFIGVSFLAVLLNLLPVFAQTDEAILRGQDVFKANKCMRCHSIEGEGGRLGPDLSHVGSRREATWLLTFLKDPRSVIPQGKQPPFKGTDQEREELVTYLSSLQ